MSGSQLLQPSLGGKRIRAYFEDLNALAEFARDVIDQTGSELLRDHRVRGHESLVVICASTHQDRRFQFDLLAHRSAFGERRAAPEKDANRKVVAFAHPIDRWI